ncbi:MAG: NifU family protein [bacterium]|nr:NifU family protein [bacterium]
MKEIEKRVVEILDKIKPYLIDDGGDLEYVKYEDGIVYIKLLGHCANCPMRQITLKENIETAIINEIPEVIEVRNVNE